MRKWTLRILVGTVALFFLVLVSLLLINSFDEGLRPDVQKILAKQPVFTEGEIKSYYYVLGLYAGDTQNPEARGQDLWLHHDEPDFWSKLLALKNRPWDIQFAGCPQNTCRVQNLIDDPTMTEALKANRVAIQNYVGLTQYGETANLFRPDGNHFYSPLKSPGLDLHRLFLLQLAEWLRQGGQERVLDLIALSNRAQQGPLHKGTLLERLLATVKLRENLEFLAAELKRSPKLRVTQDLIDSIATPDAHEIFFSGEEVELQVFDKIVHSKIWSRQFGQTAFGSDDSPPPETRLREVLPTRFFLRPNETLNRYHEIAQQILSSDCPSQIQIETCVPLANWATFSNPWHYFSNPVGRGLTAMMTMSLIRRESLQKRIDRIGELREELQP